MTLLLALIGLLGGFFSGLLGIGGAILLVPLLLFAPPMLGYPSLDMKQVAAISMVQVFFSSLTAVLTHWRHRLVSQELVVYMAIPSAVASFAGGLLSTRVSPWALQLLFSILATLATLMMFIPRREVDAAPASSSLRLNRCLAVLVGATVGMVGGMVGAPGAFLYVPILLYLFRVPTRITLGSTLAIVLGGATFGLLGKVMTGQVEWGLSLALVIGAIPGAQLGAHLAQRVRVRTLHWAITLVVLVSTVRLWEEVLRRP